MALILQFDIFPKSKMTLFLRGNFQNLLGKYLDFEQYCNYKCLLVIKSLLSLAKLSVFVNMVSINEQYKVEFFQYVVNYIQAWIHPVDKYCARDIIITNIGLFWMVLYNSFIDLFLNRHCIIDNKILANQQFCYSFCIGYSLLSSHFIYSLLVYLKSVSLY